MPVPQKRKFDTNTSAMALGASAPVAAPRLMDDGLGDSASKQALAKLNQAVTELRAITIQPLLQRAIAAIGAEDHAAAADLALKVLNRDERNGMAWYILAVAREKAGDFKSSIACYESALALLPTHSDIANDLGRLAHRLGQHLQAAKFFAIYRQANPDCPQGANNMACALRDLGDRDGAINVLRPAIIANPESGVLWNTLGTILSEQGETAQAITFFEESLRVEPGFAKARYNLCTSKNEIGDLDGALADCEAAMALSSSPSDLAMMRLARSSIYLRLGRIGEGWDDYEARLDPDFAGCTRFLIERPRWTPGDPLEGRSLLMIGEQGLGDEACFANTIPDILEALGPDGRLSLALEPRLISLFQRSFPTAQIGAHTTYKVDGHTLRAATFIDHATVDLWTPMASPLRHYRRSVEAYPNRPRFLVADPERVAYWRGVLDALPGPKIGLVWKSMKMEGARGRFFSPFEQWKPVLQLPGFSFVNLQYGDCAAELARAAEAHGVTVHTIDGLDLKDDIDGAAALCAALDLVISAPTAAAATAASVGTETWFVTAGRTWPQLGTAEYPWYARTRVFWPEKFGDWAALMPEVSDELEVFALDAERRPLVA